MKKILIVATLALAIASSALAATGPASSRDDGAKARKSHPARTIKRGHRPRHHAEAEHVRRHDDSLIARHAEPGDDNGVGREAEPGDDRGAGAEPGDDDGGHGGGRGDDGSGHH